MEIKEILSSFNRNDYQRENFDSFLSSIKFSYNVPSIHIAGTNGKGSTANYIAAIYQENGYKVGKFTSPWLFKVNEMITINNEPIKDEDFLSIFNEYEKKFKKFDLSSFEIETFIALTYFSAQKCDMAVIECGMGGEIDATNIFTPILSIITSVSLEHTEFLGHTISEVAMQKAGIIKEKVPVLIDEFHEDAVTTIYKVASSLEAPVQFIKKHVETSLNDDGVSLLYHPYGEVKLSSHALYATTDACFALEAALLLSDRFQIDYEKAKAGIKKIQMSCRFDIVNKSPLVILDGAHNPEAAKEATQAIMRYLGDHRPIHVIFSCFRDKNLGALLSSFGSLGRDLTLTTFPNPRARTEDEYFLFLGDHPFVEDAVQLVKSKMEEFKYDVILVTGSLAFVSYIKKEVFNHD